MQRTAQLKLDSTISKSGILTSISDAYKDIYNKSAVEIHRHYRTNESIRRSYSEVRRSGLGSRLLTNATDHAFASFKSCHNKWVPSDKRETSYPVIPRLLKAVIEYGQCTAEIIQDNQNSFPIWFSLQNPFNKGHRLLIPAKKTKFFNKYVEEGWKLGTSFTLKEINGNWYALLNFSKEAPAIKPQGEKMSIDVGLTKLGTTNFGEILGDTIMVKKDKLTKKDYARQRNEIGRVVNDLPLNALNFLAMEDITNIHKNKANTPKNHKQGFKVFSKTFNKRLSKAQLNYFISLVQRRCEENGVLFVPVKPYYTSQRCSGCGYKHKSNRQNENFVCLHCKFSADADVNGARNILTLALGLWDNQSPCKEDGIFLKYKEGSETILADVLPFIYWKVA